MKRLALLGSLAVGFMFVGGCPDEPDPNPTPQPDLQAPPEGEGVQFGTGKQSVAPGQEVQNCYFFKVSDLLEDGGLDATKPLNLNRVQIFQKSGSHHLNIFRVRTITPESEGGMEPEKGPYLGVDGNVMERGGACFKSPLWADWPLVANTQIDGTLDWQFPDGVANVLDPVRQCGDAPCGDEWLMVQSHYVNATTQATPDGEGEVLVNFWHLPEEEKVHEMGTLFATKQTIRVCQSLPNPSFEGGCQFGSDEEVNIVAANGHFHSRGKQFQMYAWDGVDPVKPAESEMFYESGSWDHPEMAIDNALSKAPANGGVFYTCEFQWQEPEAAVGCEGLNAYDQTKYMTAEEQLDCCYTFGPIVEKNEHCNIFVYYYPKAENVTCI